MKTRLCLALLLLAACAVPKKTAKPAPGQKAAKPAPRAAAVAPHPAPKPAEPPKPVEPPMPMLPGGPVVLSSLPSLNDFGLLANGGWNANWYVGYNTSWVVKLPPAPRGEYQRAFLGAKLGAMKTESVPGRPTWERRAIPGEIMAAIAAEPRWAQTSRYLLTRTEDIPLEGNADNALEGVGEARWFWVEIPMNVISFETDNYVAIFSSEERLESAARAPILAAGPSDRKLNAWLNSAVRGQPPLTAAEALLAPVVSYEPAVAIKLVPTRTEKPQLQWRRAPARGTMVESAVMLEAAVTGTDIQCAWVEVSPDGQAWKRLGRPQWGAPYAFTVSREVLPGGVFQVRLAAKDQWENTSATPGLLLKTSRR